MVKAQAQRGGVRNLAAFSSRDFARVHLTKWHSCCCPFVVVVVAPVVAFVVVVAVVVVAVVVVVQLAAL